MVKTQFWITCLETEKPSSKTSQKRSSCIASKVDSPEWQQQVWIEDRGFEEHPKLIENVNNAILDLRKKRPLEHTKHMSRKNMLLGRYEYFKFERQQKVWIEDWGFEEDPK